MTLTIAASFICFLFSLMFRMAKLPRKLCFPYMPLHDTDKNAIIDTSSQDSEITGV